MNDENLYSVLVVRGDIFEINDPYSDVLRFGDLSYTEAVDLIRKSIERGYTACIWSKDGDTEARADE